MKSSYLRFETRNLTKHTGLPEGIFGTTYELVYNSELAPHLHGPIVEIYDWFRDELKKPDRFNRSKSRGSSRRNASGVSWIKSTAVVHLAKLRELSILISEAGYTVNERVTDRPGYIVYEDEFQIVAEPFQDGN